jgi:peroxiredoxin
MVIGISLDRSGELVKEFLRKRGVNYPVVLATEEMVNAFGGVEVIPTTFIIDRKGRIAGRHEGFTAKEEFEREIKPLLE